MKNKYNCVASVGVGGIPAKFVGPLRGCDTLPEYFDMPFTNLEGVQAQRNRIDEGKNAIRAVIKTAQDETPNKLLGQVLFDYWGRAEAFGSCVPGNIMAPMCKSYVIAIEEMGLAGKLETNVREVDLTSD